MEIHVPLDSPQEVEPLSKAGATAFYAGLSLRGFPFALNARWERGSNFTDFGCFAEAVQEARSHGVDTFLCLNGSCHENIKGYLFRVIDKALELGLSRFIVKDIGFLLELKKHAPQCILTMSTLSECFNSQAIEFYRDLGVTRIVLPGQLSLEEIGVLRKRVSGIDFEVVLLNSICNYINGFCRIHKLCNIATPKIKFLSRAFSVLNGRLISECKSLYRGEVYKNDNRNGQKENICIGNGLVSCGACGVPFLCKVPVQALKIVGRGFAAKKKIKDVKFLRSVLDLVDRPAQNKGADLTNLIISLYREIYGRSCLSPEQCHFPKL